MVTPNELTDWAVALGDVTQQPHFHKDSFRIKKKIFATLDRKKKLLVVKLNEIDQSVFCKVGVDIVYPVPGAWGKQGWTMVDLQKIKKTICQDILTTAFETVKK